MSRGAFRLGKDEASASDALEGRTRPFGGCRERPFLTFTRPAGHRVRACRRPCRGAEGVEPPCGLCPGRRTGCTIIDGDVSGNPRGSDIDRLFDLAIKTLAPPANDMTPVPRWRGVWPSGGVNCNRGCRDPAFLCTHEKVQFRRCPHRPTFPKPFRRRDFGRVPKSSRRSRAFIIAPGSDTQAADMQFSGRQSLDELSVFLGRVEWLPVAVGLGGWYGKAEGWDQKA